MVVLVSTSTLLVPEMPLSWPLDPACTRQMIPFSVSAVMDRLSPMMRVSAELAEVPSRAVVVFSRLRTWTVAPMPDEELGLRVGDTFWRKALVILSLVETVFCFVLAVVVRMVPLPVPILPVRFTVRSELVA